MTNQVGHGQRLRRVSWAEGRHESVGLKVKTSRHEYGFWTSRSRPKIETSWPQSKVETSQLRPNVELSQLRLKCKVELSKYF